MKILPLLLPAAMLLLATACSSSDSPDTGASPGGGALSEVECRALVDKSREVHGMPPDAFAEAIEADIARCASEGTLSQEEYDCGMAATSPAEFDACGIDIT